MGNSAIALGGGSANDYDPYGQKADPTSVGSLIMSLSPGAYYPCDDASGNPQDVSGNARHMTSAAADLTGILYRQPAITSKGSLSVQLENNRLYPWAPQQLNLQSGTFTYIGLFQMDALGAGSIAMNPSGIEFFGEVYNVSYCAIRVGLSNLYQNVLTMYSGYGSLLQAAGNANVNGWGIGKPFVFAFVGTSLHGLSYSFEAWISGERVMTHMPRVSHGYRGYANFGRPVAALNASAPFARMRMSNLAIWPLQLTERQIMDITETMLDDAAYAVIGG